MLKSSTRNTRFILKIFLRLEKSKTTLIQLLVSKCVKKAIVIKRTMNKMAQPRDLMMQASLVLTKSMLMKARDAWQGAWPNAAPATRAGRRQPAAAREERRR